MEPVYITQNVFSMDSLQFCQFCNTLTVDAITIHGKQQPICEACIKDFKFKTVQLCTHFVMFQDASTWLDTQLKNNATRIVLTDHTRNVSEVLGCCDFCFKPCTKQVGSPKETKWICNKCFRSIVHKLRPISWNTDMTVTVYAKAIAH